MRRPIVYNKTALDKRGMYQSLNVFGAYGAYPFSLADPGFLSMVRVKFAVRPAGWRRA